MSRGVLWSIVVQNYDCPAHRGVGVKDCLILPITCTASFFLPPLSD